MFGGNKDSDKSLLKAVSKRLERTGTQSRLTCTVQSGAVTLRGKLQYEKQRMAIVKAVQGVSGVRNVVDQLQAPPKVQTSMTNRATGQTTPTTSAAVAVEAAAAEVPVDEPVTEAVDALPEPTA